MYILILYEFIALTTCYAGISYKLNNQCPWTVIAKQDNRHVHHLNNWNGNLFIVKFFHLKSPYLQVNYIIISIQFHLRLMRPNIYMKVHLRLTSSFQSICLFANDFDCLCLEITPNLQHIYRTSEQLTFHVCLFHLFASLNDFLYCGIQDHTSAWLTNEREFVHLMHSTSSSVTLLLICLAVK